MATLNLVALFVILSLLSETLARGVLHDWEGYWPYELVGAWISASRRFRPGYWEEELAEIGGVERHTREFFSGHMPGNIEWGNEWDAGWGEAPLVHDANISPSLRWQVLIACAKKLEQQKQAQQARWEYALSTPTEWVDRWPNDYTQRATSVRAS